MFDGILQNFGVYLDGVGYLGTVEEVQLPKITAKTSEWTAAGMSGTVDVDTGKVEKMEATIKLKVINQAAIKTIFTPDVPLLIRGSLAQKDGSSKKLVIEIRGLMKEYDMGTINVESQGDTSIAISVNYYRIAIDGTDVVEIDPIANIRKVDGKNKLENVIANISN